MKIKQTFAAAAVALTLTAGAGFAAQDANPDKTEHRHRARRGQHGFGGNLLGRATVALDLTEQQKQFAQQLMADTRKQAEPLTAELRQNRKELAEAVKANNLSAIDQLTQRQGTLTGQIGALRGKAMASFYAQLTPEQKAKADQFRSMARERAGRWQKKSQ